MIESFFDPDILLYCPSTVAVLGTWAEHKPDGNSVWVWGPIVLLHHMNILMVPNCWCVMSRQIGLGLKV